MGLSHSSGGAVRVTDLNLVDSRESSGIDSRDHGPASYIRREDSEVDGRHYINRDMGSSPMERNR